MNPLMQAMNGSNSKIAQAVNVMKMLRSGNPDQIAQQMMQNNPQFRQFVEQNKGKTPQQVAQENGFDLNQIMGMMK
jgi:hypothetical protein